MISIGNLKIAESTSVRTHIFGKCYIRKFDEDEFRSLFSKSDFTFDDYVRNLDNLVFAGFGKSVTEDTGCGTAEASEMWSHYREILLPLNLFFKFPVFIFHEFEWSGIVGESRHLMLAPGSEYGRSPSYLYSYDAQETPTYDWQNELSIEELRKRKIEEFFSKFNQYLERLKGKEKKNILLIIDRFGDSIVDFANLQNLDDACCKCIRGLEVLYLGGEVGNKKLLLADRIAMMTHPGEENWTSYMSKCKQRVKGLYNKRNDIQHAGKTNLFKRDDFVELREYLRKSILSFISLRVEQGNEEIRKFLEDSLSSENRAAIRQCRGLLLATKGED